jgi:saxitoxin biosynthesis operon SxtJ-like protein
MENTQQENWKGFIQKNITKEQSKDTGMALVLILLLATLASKKNMYVYWAVAVHVVNMIAPQVYRPAAVVWFTFAHVMGMVVSKVMLSIIFFGFVTPVGIVRKILGKDSMQLRSFRGSSKSVLIERNHTFTGSDIEQPY